MTDLDEDQSKDLPFFPSFSLRTIFVLVTVLAIGLGIWINTDSIWGLLYFSYLFIAIGFSVPIFRQRLLVSLILFSLHTLLITANAVLFSFKFDDFTFPQIAAAALLYLVDLPIHWIFMALDIMPANPELLYLSLLVPFGGSMWFAIGLLSHLFGLLDFLKLQSKKNNA